jgi:ADP-ribose pyrophosphatase
MTNERSRIASRRVYAGRIINVDVDTVTFPDGSTGDLEMVRHPGASAVVPVLTSLDDDDPQVLLIKQYRYAADDFIYEIPAGKLDGGEDPLVCAKRELKEETGCTATQVEHLYTFFTTPGFTDERIHAFVATGLTRGESSHERDEFMTVEAHPLSRVLEMIRSGEMRDAKSALTILYLAGFRLGR